MVSRLNASPPQSDRVTAMRAMRAAGSSVPAIAAEFSLSATRIFRLLARPEQPSADEAALQARFPGLPSRLARRLDGRFPEDADLRIAADADLLSMRHMTPAHLNSLRTWFPQSGDDGPSVRPVVSPSG